MWALLLISLLLLVYDKPVDPFSANPSKEHIGTLAVKQTSYNRNSMCVPVLTHAIVAPTTIKKQYPRSQITRWRKNAGYPASDTCAKLKTLNIFRARGSVGGREVIRNIPTLVTSRIVLTNTGLAPTACSAGGAIELSNAPSASSARIYGPSAVHGPVHPSDPPPPSPPPRPNLRPLPRLWYNLPPILSLNAQSLSDKIGLLQNEINATLAGIVAVTEAWTIVPSACNIPDFSLFYCPRTFGRILMLRRNILSW